MEVIDLFSGIGGFALASQWAGFKTVQFCEIDSYCQSILNKHWPTIPIHNDIKTLTREKIEEGPWDSTKPTIVVGGFPCQPFSNAGLGLGEKDDRNLWPYMLRIVQEVQPDFVVAENVSGLLSKKHWATFRTIITQLVDSGYTSGWVVDFTADSIGLPTMERHIWIVAASNRIRQQGVICKEIQDFSILSREFQGSYTGDFGRWAVPESRVCRVGQRIPNRMDRLRALGNAIPPQMAYQILKPIIDYTQCTHYQ